MVEKVAASYGVSAMQGVLSHQNKKHVIDGNRCIANKTTIEHKVDEVTFEASDVFTLDFVMSSGEGKPIEQAARTTVFKRAIDQVRARSPRLPAAGDRGAAHWDPRSSCRARASHVRRCRCF